MKTFGIIHILLFLILLLAYQCVQAQDYVVTATGDTLRGKIRLLNYGPEKKVQLTPEGRKKETYSMMQVRSVHSDGDIYEPQRGPTGYAFMRVITPGFLSLYAFQRENQSSYDGLLLAKKDGTSIEVPNLGFKKVMARFLADCEIVQTKIENGTFGRNDLNEIITTYNDCLEQKSDAPVAPTAPAVVETPTMEPAKPAPPALASLEEKLKALPDFGGKDDAIDMLTEIRKKIARSEKVPNFLIEGLKDALKDTSLKDEAATALEELR